MSTNLINRLWHLDTLRHLLLFSRLIRVTRLILGPFKRHDFLLIFVRVFADPNSSHGDLSFVEGYAALVKPISMDSCLVEWGPTFFSMARMILLARARISIVPSYARPTHGC